ncbi:thermonuclease family protein [Planctomicrobium sp. SH661]|uniref:thermonuclease family protein n=1 Tax=Planctomicrobium sp. SH661 TaxID=3448124 RepID=UPI003F5C9677
MKSYDRMTAALSLIVIFAAAAFLLWCFDHARAGDPPMPQVVLPCEVTDVYDGDTLTVRVTLDLRIRLLDCWAAELHTKDLREKQAGLAAAETLKAHAVGQSGVLMIPIGDAGRLDDLFTFGRLLAHVQLSGDKQTLSEWMVKKGHAKPTKAELEKLLGR